MMAKRRPNVVDFIIIAVVILLIALAAYKFGVVNKQEATSLAEEQRQITYTAFIDEVRMATVNALHEGDQVFDEKTGICIGTITGVSYEPRVKNVLDNSGNMITVEVPDYYGITLTIEGGVVEKEDGYFVDGIVELKANSEMDVYTKYAEPVIKVTQIDI